MELPDWVVDEAQPQVSPTAFALLVRLFRYGRPVEDSDGGQRIYWRGTRQQLTKISGAGSRRSIMAALAQLGELGFVTAHAASGMHKRSGFSAPFELARVAKIATLSESESAHHGGGANTSLIQIRTNDHPTTTTPHAREDEEAILASLAAAGVNHAASWVARFGLEQCRAALDRVAAAEANSTITNPAGLMRTWLDRGIEPEPEPEDPFEAQKRRFLGGPLGHIVRYK